MPAVVKVDSFAPSGPAARPSSSARRRRVPRRWWPRRAAGPASPARQAPVGERTAQVLAGDRRTAVGRGRGQARPFEAADLARRPRHLPRAAAPSWTLELLSDTDRLDELLTRDDVCRVDADRALDRLGPNLAHLVNTVQDLSTCGVDPSCSRQEEANSRRSAAMMAAIAAV